MNIEWRYLAEAVEHYEEKGYKYLEVPWLVSEPSCNITCPPWCRLFETFAGCLVASGEQSFLEIRQTLAPGRYQCVTPCFRDEETPDDLHLQYFVKNELIRVLPPNSRESSQEREVEEIIMDAFDFFEKVYCGSKIRIVETTIGKDIEINQIEVGSYGFREYNGFAWVYGTGCALPRLSQALGGR